MKHLTRDDKARLITKCARSEGYGPKRLVAFYERIVSEGMGPGICVECEQVSDSMEPDQDQGWCEHCGQQTVQSPLILAGVI